MITQHIDRIITRRDFRTVDSLAVTSIFETIQGEGPYAGRPCLFLRMAGCNFGDKSADRSCAFCDTSFELAKAKHYTVAELVRELTGRLKASNLDLIVITGGEPTLQANLAKVIAAIKLPIVVQFETNGTQGYFPKLLDDTRSDDELEIAYVVSPKANGKAGRYPKIASEYLDNTSNAVLKFVVTADVESPHHTVPDWALACAVPIIYVSPMAVYLRSYEGEVSNAWDHTLVDPVATSKNYAYAAQYVMELSKAHSHTSFRLSLQTHLFTNIP